MERAPRRGRDLLAFIGVAAVTALLVSWVLVGFMAVAWLAGVLRDVRRRGLPVGVALAVLAGLFVHNTYLFARAPASIHGPLGRLFLHEPWMFAATYAVLGLAAFFAAWCGVFTRRLLPHAFPGLALYRAMAGHRKEGAGGTSAAEAFYASLMADEGDEQGQDGGDEPGRPPLFDE